MKIIDAKVSVSNFGIQEYVQHTKETDEVFPHRYFFKDVFLHPGDGPDFGVDYDDKLAESFPTSVRSFR